MEIEDLDALLEATYQESTSSKKPYTHGDENRNVDANGMSEPKYSREQSVSPQRKQRTVETNGSDSPRSKHLASSRSKDVEKYSPDKKDASRSRRDREERESRDERDGRNGRDSPSKRSRNSSRDRTRRRDRSRSRRRRSRSPSPRRYRRRSRSRSNNRTSSRRKSRSRSPIVNNEDRDSRTVFVMQIAQRARTPDVKDFFSKAGKVRGTRLVYDKISKRSKGVGYVEFYLESSVPKAVGMTGQKLFGVPVIVQPSEADKNKSNEEAPNEYEYFNNNKIISTFTRLHLQNLHDRLNEDDIRAVFSAFGVIEETILLRDFEGRSKGSAYIQFKEHEEAKKALEAMHSTSFELAGKIIKASVARDRANGYLDEGENILAMTSSGRAELMKKLAERKDGPEEKLVSNCLLLTNMYDPSEETEPNWDTEIAQDVTSECTRFGPVRHCKVTKTVEGDVYLQFTTLDAAKAAFAALNGRLFAKRKITVFHVPEKTYISMFPEAKAIMK